MRVTCWIEWGLALVMLGGPGFVLWGRFRRREEDDTSPRGLGVRLIQLVGLLLIVPLIGILMLECKMSNEAGTALIGVAIGYALSGIERPVPSGRSPQHPPAATETGNPTGSS
jgi:hypothetical protein